MRLEAQAAPIAPRMTFRIGPGFGSNESIKQAVMAGLGIGFISAHTIAAEVELGRLVVLDVIDTPVRRQWFAVSRSDRSHAPAMKLFRDFVARCGATFLPTLRACRDSLRRSGQPA